MNYKNSYFDIVISDEHCGSPVGLFPCDDVVYTDDDCEIRPNKNQELMWQFIREEVLDYVSSIKKADKNVIVRTRNNGDLVEGFHHESTQVMTSSPVTMQNIGYFVIKSFADISDEVVIIRGTESHVGKSAVMEENIAIRLKATYPKKVISNVSSETHWFYEEITNGVRTNYIHQGGVGKNPRTRLNPLLIKAITQLEYRISNHIDMADLFVSSHAHQYADTKDILNYTRVIQTPCMKLTDAYGHKVSPNIAPSLGVMAIYYHQDGSYEVIHFDFAKWIEKNHILMGSIINTTPEVVYATE